MDYTPLWVFAATPLVVSGMVYVLVLRMSKPEQMLKPLDGGFSDARQRELLAYKEWLDYVGLHYLTSFQFSGIQVAVFQQTGTQRFFEFTFHKTLTYSIISRFDDLSFFETATSNSTGMFPARPGQYRQSLPGVRADQAWARHLEAEAYIMQKFGLTWQPLSGSYEETLINSLRVWMQYVRSIPFWPFRALWWYSTRTRLANKTVQQMYP